MKKLLLSMLALALVAAPSYALTVIDAGNYGSNNSHDVNYVYPKSSKLKNDVVRNSSDNVNLVGLFNENSLDWVSRFGHATVPMTPPVVEPPKDDKPATPHNPKPIRKPSTAQCGCELAEGDISFFVGTKAFSVVSRGEGEDEAVDFVMVDCANGSELVKNTIEDAYAEISVRGGDVTVVVKASKDNSEVWRFQF